MKQLVMSIPVWFAKRDLHERRADFYYDLASTLKDRVPLFTTIRKLESRAQQRTPLSAPMYLQMLKGLEGGSLSEALRGIASTTELTMIDATQAAGDATMADGLLTSLGDLTFAVIRRRVERIVTVSEPGIAAAMRLIWERMKLVVEPSSAVALAALLEGDIDVSGRRVGIILSGGNVELGKLPWRD